MTQDQPQPRLTIEGIIDKYFPEQDMFTDLLQDDINAFAQQEVEAMDLQRLMNDVSEWSDATFGENQRNPGIIYHLKKEIDELIEKLNLVKYDGFSMDDEEAIKEITGIIEEYADCFMLLMDSAHHFGLSAKELINHTRAKLEVNKNRRWGKPDENGVVEHIKEQEG